MTAIAYAMAFHWDDCLHWHCVVCVGANALPASTTVKELESGDSKNLTLLIREFNFLSSGRHSPRRDFESSRAFEERILSNTQAFIHFLSKRYELVAAPDEVSLDWQNAVVRIGLHFPIVVRRERGGDTDTTRLTISAKVDPNTARIIKTFPNQTVVKVQFHFLQDRSILIDDLVAQINGKDFYHE